MAVRGGNGVRVAGVHLVLAVPRLALGELDRNACGLHPAADRPEVGLVHGRREDVVVEDVGDRRSEVPVVLLVGLGVALLVQIELELGGEERCVAHLGRALVLGDQDLAGRGDDRRAVVVDDVAQHHRGAVEPWDPAQRCHVRGDAEVAVALLPVRHLVARHGLHLHVEGEEVVAALDPVLGDLVEEVVDLDPLAEQTALHVRERRDDGVDRARLGLVLEVVEREHPGGATGAAWALCRHDAARSRLAITWLDVRSDLVLLESPHRSLVLVLGGHEVPDAEDQREQDRERCVVHEACVESVVPRQTER